MNRCATFTRSFVGSLAIACLPAIISIWGWRVEWANTDAASLFFFFFHLLRLPHFCSTPTHPLLVLLYCPALSLLLLPMLLLLSACARPIQSSSSSATYFHFVLRLHSPLCRCCCRRLRPPRPHSTSPTVVITLVAGWQAGRRANGWQLLALGPCRLYGV